jgi:prephenate dehydrogenase
MRRIAIIGLGLIGGSLALALRRDAPDLEILGIAPREATLRQALELQAIHKGDSDLRAAEECDLAVIATPITAVEETLRALATASRKGLLLTDVASTKVQVLAWARALLPDAHRFLGGHPMAGKERTGLAAAEPGLFEGAVWALTPAPAQDLHAFEGWLDLIRRIGAQPLLMDAGTHDQQAAAVSHLAFVISAAYVDAVGSDPAWPEMAKLASSGFRDMTRLASGSPSLYAQIARTNPQALGAWIERFRAVMETYLEAIKRDDPALRRHFEKAKATRDRWVKERHAPHGAASPRV